MRFAVLSLSVLLFLNFSALGSVVLTDDPVFSVASTTTEPCVGSTFSVNVTIANVSTTNSSLMVWGYAFQLFYNSSVLNCSGVVVPLDNFLMPSNPDNLLIVKNESDNLYNATHGRVWVAACLISGDEQPKGGHGVLAVATFQAVGTGSTGLCFSDLELVGIDASDNCIRIPFTFADGFVTVISQPTCAMKTKMGTGSTDGYFYMPNLNLTCLKVELLFNNSDLNGDQTGNASPYSTVTHYPDGKVNMQDTGFISSKFGLNENSSDWDYMADVYPDGKIDMRDISIASRNFGKNGTYTTDLTGVTVNFNTGQETAPDSYGFVAIPSGAANFTVTRYGNKTGAMIVFWR